MAGFNYNNGLMKPDKFADRYFAYQMGMPDPAPHELAMHMILVQDASAHNNTKGSLSDKIYNKMSPDVRKDVSESLHDGDYCNTFMDSLVEKHKSVLGSNVDENALRTGLSADLDQTVECACSGMMALTPVQNVREFAKQNGASQNEIRSVISSAICDLGRYYQPDAGFRPSDDVSFRCNSVNCNYAVNYAVDADQGKIVTMGVDGIRHDITGEDAADIMKSAISEGSLHKAVDQSFDHGTAIRNFETDVSNGITAFGHRTNGSGLSANPVTAKMYFVRDGEPYFTTESVYQVRDRDKDPDVTSDSLISKNTVFQDTAGMPLKDNKLDECRRYYRHFGFTENEFMSASEAEHDIRKNAVDQVTNAFGEFGNDGISVRSHMTTINSNVPSCNIVIGQTHFDMDSLSDMLKSRGVELLDDSDRNIVFSDDSQSWQFSKTAGSNMIQASIPTDSKSLPVFDFRVSGDTGVRVGQVYVPDITQQEKTDFTDLVERYVNKGYEDAGLQFKKVFGKQRSFDRELPDVSQSYEDSYNVEL